jgi:hypothetical protein
VQIVGAVLTVASVTLYMGHGWMVSRREQAAASASALLGVDNSAAPDTGEAPGTPTLIAAKS